MENIKIYEEAFIKIFSVDKNELLKLLNSEVNTCKNVDFKIFGLSLATINFLLSFIVFILILKVIKNEKNK